MMMGIGTPSSQSRIPRPMELSLQPTFPTGTSHSHTDSRTGITNRSSSPTKRRAGCPKELWSYGGFRFAGPLRTDPRKIAQRVCSKPQRRTRAARSDRDDHGGAHALGEPRAEYPTLDLLHRSG